MVSLSRSVNGLLYRSDGTLSGWTGDAQWSSVSSDPQFVCYPIGLALFAPDFSGADMAGVREGQLYIESGVWWLLYDAGDGVNGWRQYLAQSVDRGLTWRRLGALSMGLNKVVSGTWPAVATGWLEKRGATYYCHRVLAAANYAVPNNGLPGGPYYWDCWTNAVLGAAGWTPSPNVPAGNQRYALSGAGSIEHLPGGMVLSGGTYNNFAELSASGGVYTLGLSTGSNPDGPFTAPASALASSATTGFGGRAPENGRAFWSATLNRWICLANLIALSGQFTDANAIGYSTSLTDWSSSVWRRIQAVTTMDTAGGAVGLISHVTGPDGALIVGPNGEVPVIYDADPLRFSPGWHLGRRLRSAVLEPSASALSIAQSGNTTLYAVRRSLSHTDLVIELAVCVTAVNGSGLSLRVEYRGDATGQNGYRALLTNAAGLSLEKVVAGTPSTKATSSGTLIYSLYQMHRIKITVVGNVHTLWLDGEQQISYTDSSSPITSGTTIGLSAQGATCTVRNMTARTTDTITVTGLQPYASVWLRGHGDLPVAAGTANAAGQATITVTHWPHYALDPDGSDYTVANALWGGDTVDFTGLPTTPLPVACSPRGRR